ncbi:hypothetical protein OBBRIDRAFT_391300 [Obba rivulosa]|uniref:TERF2-interacting telomeric protein 1 Myb domain-containing protein n=1 Tax=Obba rivulosa TaxID=1052685 RepID=A0A8E2ASS3_9APHY|nr:hypothetical protein OBBRIDRAFT_391300 [Obba rivulosa]
MPTGRNEFTEEEDTFLGRYLAQYAPSEKGRSGNTVYQNLCENVCSHIHPICAALLIMRAQADNQWPLAKNHTWHSWRNRYVKNKDTFDKWIRNFQRKKGIKVPSTPVGTPGRTPRRAFTAQDDEYLIEYISQHSREPKNRTGKNLFIYLCNNTDKFPWAANHPMQSWLERYRKSKDEFDEIILKRQNSRGFKFIKDVTGFQGGQKVRHLDARSRSRAQSESRSASPVVRDKGKGKEREAGLTAVHERGSPSHKRRRVDIEDDRTDGGRTTKRARTDDNRETSGSATPASGEESETESESEEDQSPPDSEDYRGEIFDADADEQEDHLASDETSQGGDEDVLRDATATPGRQSSVHGTPKQSQTTHMPYSIPAQGGTDTTSSPKITEDHTEPTISQEISAPETLRTQTHAEEQFDNDRVETDTGHTTYPNDLYASGDERARASAMSSADRTQSHFWTFEPSSSQATLMTSTPKPKPPKRKLPAPHGDDLDFFGTDPPTPPYDAGYDERTPRATQRMRAPPRLIDGAFNSAFTDAQGRSRVSASGSRPRVSGIAEEEEDEEGTAAPASNAPDEAWPPNRHSNRNKGKGKERVHAFERSRSPQPRLFAKPQAVPTAEAVKKEHQDLLRLLRDARGHHAFSQPSQSSQEVVKPSPIHHSEHHAFSQPTQQPLAHIDGAPIAASHRPKIESRAGPNDLDLSIIEKALERADSSRREVQLERSITVTKAASTPGPGTRPESPFKVPAVPARPSSASEPLMGPPSRIFVGNPSRQTVTARGDDKGKQKEFVPILSSDVAGPSRRHTIGNHTVAVKAGLPADPSDRLQERPLRPRQSAPLPQAGPSHLSAIVDTSLSRRIAASPPRSRPELTLEMCDSLPGHERLMAIHFMIQRMAQNHGFSEDMVMAVLQKEGSLQRTDEMLCRMRESAERTALESWQAYDEEPPLEDSPQPSSPERTSPAKISRRRVQATPSPLLVSNLQYTAVAAQNGEFVGSPVYVPPRETRARQHWRRLSDVTSDHSRADANNSLHASPERPELSRPSLISPLPAPSTPRARTPTSEEEVLEVVTPHARRPPRKDEPVDLVAWSSNLLAKLVGSGS